MTMPKYGLGARLRDLGDFVGEVDAIYKDLDTAIACRVIDHHWYGQQHFLPSTGLQIFYLVVGADRTGGVLVGENDCKLMTV